MKSHATNRHTSSLHQRATQLPSGRLRHGLAARPRQ